MSGSASFTTGAGHPFGTFDPLPTIDAATVAVPANTSTNRGSFFNVIDWILDLALDSLACRPAS